MIAPHVDGKQIVYFGEADFAAKVKLYGGARALLYPIQAPEPFGLVLAEAMACGTPVAALDRGAVREVVDDGITGIVFENLDDLTDGLDRVLVLNRRRVRDHAVARFGIDRMVDEYVAVYRRIIEARVQSGGADMIAGQTILAVFAHPDDESLACGGTLARLADAGARVIVICASRGERGSHTGPVRDDSLGRTRGAEIRAAARTLGVAELILLNHPDGDLRWCEVSELHAELLMFMRRHRSGGGDHLWRGRPLLASRSHRDSRADDHRRARARRQGSAALLRDDAGRRDAADRRFGQGARLDAAAERILEPGAGGVRPARGRPTLVVDVADCVPRKLAAICRHASQMVERATPSRAYRTRRPALARTSNISIGRHHAVVPETRFSKAYAHRHPGHPALPVLRRPARARHLAAAPLDRRSRSRTACSAASAASFRSWTAFPCCICSRRRSPRANISRRDAPNWRCAAWSVSRTSVRPSSSRRRGIPGVHVPATSSRRSGPNFEGGYFLYRFSDPTFIVADAVVRAVAGTALRSGGRALDICGGSGHLTRTLVELSSPAPVLADLFFAKIWLARRYTAPGCDPICCDGNVPLPFARGAFGYAMCSDAFMFIWTKRQFVSEMFRLVDGSANASAVVINHTHNQLCGAPRTGNR